MFKRKKVTRLFVPVENLPRIVADLEFDSLHDLINGINLCVRTVNADEDIDHSRLVVDLDPYQTEKLLNKLPRRTLQDEYGGRV